MHTNGSEAKIVLWCKGADYNYYLDIGISDLHPGSAGIFKDDKIISEDSPRSPKSSEEV